jgi:CRP-like cAMP-binding protein
VDKSYKNEEVNMITPEILQQHPYFKKLNIDQAKCLVENSHSETVKAGDFLFHKGDELVYFYLVIKGEIEIVNETPMFSAANSYLGKPDDLHQEILVLSVVKPGEFLGWSGLVRPHLATSCVRAKKDSNLIAFSCKELLNCFEEDCELGYYMLLTAASVIGKRLHDVYQGG